MIIYFARRVVDIPKKLDCMMSVRCAHESFITKSKSHAQLRNITRYILSTVN